VNIVAAGLLKGQNHILIYNQHYQSTKGNGCC